MIIEELGHFVIDMNISSNNNFITENEINNINEICDNIDSITFDNAFDTNIITIILNETNLINNHNLCFRGWRAGFMSKIIVANNIYNNNSNQNINDICCDAAQSCEKSEMIINNNNNNNIDVFCSGKP